MQRSSSHPDVMGGLDANADVRDGAPTSDNTIAHLTRNPGTDKRKRRCGSASRTLQCGESGRTVAHMADTVAIVSIVSGAAVAITVPIITARLDRNRLKWETEERRIDETRVVIDGALQDYSDSLWQLHFAWRALAGLSAHRVGSFRAPMPTDFSVAAGLQRANHKRAAAMAQSDRLAVRLGNDHPIVRNYEHGLFVVGGITARLARAQSLPADRDGLAETDEWSRAVRGELEKAWKLRQVIVEEASRLAGVRSREGSAF
jgi:hypothetical protein